jgi:hypothetical protein
MLLFAFHNHCSWESRGSGWLSGHKLSYDPYCSDHIVHKFDLRFISNLLVSTRYYPGLDAHGHNYFVITLCCLDEIWWPFPAWMKWGHLDSHKGWLCPVTSIVLLVTEYILIDWCNKVTHKAPETVLVQLGTKSKVRMKKVHRQNLRKNSIMFSIKLVN